MTQSERVKAIRKHYGLTAEKFGAKIGFKRSTISQLENGKYGLTEQTILMICKEFIDIDENWLRTGEGDMIRTLKLDDYARAATTIGITDPAAREALLLYWHLSDDEKKVFWSLVKKFITSDILSNL